MCIMNILKLLNNYVLKLSFEIKCIRDTHLNINHVCEVCMCGTLKYLNT